jgi:hypothetical protein
MTFATDTNHKELILCVVHKWYRMGRVHLQIKELQTFETKTILSLFNIFTATNKKILLAELQEILTTAQSQAQKHDPSEFWWGLEDTAPNSSLPPLELRLQNPKLPGQDTSHFNKLSWQVQANWKVYVECDRRLVKNIQNLMHFSKEMGLVTKFWGRHAQVSEVVDIFSSPSKIRRLVQVAQHHTSYQ